MELYIGRDLVAAEAKVDDLESSLTAVKALAGTKDLCLQPDEEGPQLILTVIPRAGFFSPERYCIEHVKERCVAGLFTPGWKTAADCARRFLAGRLPFPGALTEDGCPLCRIGH